jgi:pSer/pThr/pTyr-binding forkhead associated (FHA) protein
MKDGRTRKLATRSGAGADFLAANSVLIVFASGALAGTEVPLDKRRVTLGRGAGADVSVADAGVSNLHAALELGERGFRLRDLGSTNGIVVNGAKVGEADLKHGDRFELGGIAFRYVVEPRSKTPTHHLNED